MKHLRTLFHCTAISIFILLVACTPTTYQITPTQINTVTSKNSPEPTNTLKPTIKPTLTATKTFPAPTAELKCPKLNPDIKFNFSADPKDFEISLLNYLNVGGNPTKIEPIPSSSELSPFYIATADLDSDTLPEIVVSDNDLNEFRATIRIYHCGQNDYHLAKIFAPEDLSFGVIEFVTKIFRSEPSFVIIRTSHISGWGQYYLAIGWRDSEWQIIDLPAGTTPSEIALFDQNMDGTKEVYIKTRTAATPGGGVSRVVIDTYSWNGEKFIPVSSDMPPGDDRVHYLQDAETALDHRNPLLAISYYEIAARDSNLSSYWTSYELMHNQTKLAKPYQQAYAFFRIVAIWFYLDQPEVASRYIEEMSGAFPRGRPGNEFVLAAQALSEWYGKSSDLPKSCQQAVNLLDTQYPDIVKNHLGDWGVENPMYFATSDICNF